jgi:hypothetical protein
MSLSELKSNLSSFRKPAPSAPPTQTREVNKSFQTPPITDQVKRHPVDKNPLSSKLNINSIFNIDGTPDKSKLTGDKPSADLQNLSKPTGRHTTGKDVENLVKIEGHHIKGKDVVITTSPTGNISSKINLKELSVPTGHNLGSVEVSNGSPIQGRHTKGKDVFAIGKPNDKHLKDESGLNIDGLLTKYTDLTTPYGLHGSPVDVGSSQFDIDSLSTKYDNLVSLYGLHGDPVPTIQSGLDIDSIPIKYDNLHKSAFGLHGKPVDPIESLLDLDYSPSKYVDVFTTGLFNPFPKKKSLLDINNIPKKSEGRINRRRRSGLDWNGLIAPSVNYFDNKKSGATGFKIKAVDPNKSSFLGISGQTFQYPNLSSLGKRLMEVGTFKLTTQLGDGSPIFKNTGFHSKNKYSLKVGTDGLLGERYTRRNSPSYLDLLYGKYNLQDASWNPSYIKQPFILRGIQRKSPKEPQYWGSRNLGFDDGLIRGGMGTALMRSAIDTERIAKLLASPRGLVWVGKQIGLGLTNPKVEVIGGGPLARLTRVHTGVTSLLSVPTTAFGLHYTTHGLPFVNEIASYERVQNAKRILGTSSNRLFKLKKELLGEPQVGVVGKLLAGLQSIGSKLNVFKGSPIQELSGLAGPNSVYGVGATSIRRYTDTRSEATIRAEEYEFVTTENIKNQYASKLALGFKASAKTTQQESVTDWLDFDKYKVKNPERNRVLKANKNADKPYQSNGRTEELNRNWTTGDSSIKKYETLAYGKLKKNDTKDGASNGFNDFREGLSSVANAFNTKLEKILNKDLKYRNTNLEKKFGFGAHGASGQDKSDYTEETDRGDKINKIDVQYTKYDDLISVKKGPNDFIKFFFSGPDQMKDGKTDSTDVMVFRATMTKLTDNFKPTWDNVSMIGRADPVYLYKSFERDISFDFKVAATSREEMKPIWRKLNALAGYTAPKYVANNLMQGPFMRITIGDYFQETPGFITSLTFDVDENTPWEINLEEDKDMYQLPMVVNVSVAFTIISDFKPQRYGRFFSLSHRGMENGDGNWLDYSNVKGLNYDPERNGIAPAKEEKSKTTDRKNNTPSPVAQPPGKTYSVPAGQSRASAD